MKTLIYGHKGWIGTQFVNHLKQIKNYEYVLGKSRLDDNFTRELDEVMPTHVVCFIGRTHGTINDISYPTIDYLEQPGKLKENIRDNLFAPVSMALECSKRNIHLTYLGTGCIFSYEGFGPHDDPNCHQFTEDDLPNFTGSGYSTVKGFTDRLMHHFSDKVLNLRIRMPIVGYDCSRNFITKIKTYQKICSMPNSMTVLPDVIPSIYQMMEKSITGTVNLTNPGYITHNKILELYRDLVDNTFTWENFTIEEQNKIIESHRSNNVLCTSTIEDLAKQGIISTIPNIETSITNLLKDYKIDVSLRKEITGLSDNKFTTILVTGGAGFIGSNFVNYLHDTTKNLSIINFDALYYAGDINNINQNVRDSSRYIFIHGNLQSFDLLKYLFQINTITHIIHFAAQSHVQNSFRDSLNYTADNVIGTHNLLEACRLYCKDLNRFIHVSTDEVYGESMLLEEQCKTENSILCPTNPYAASKAAAELIAQSYFHSFNMPIIITRGNNVYGKNQYPEKVIPLFIKQLRNNEKVTIQGSGSVVRAFLHVTDTVHAFYHVLTSGKIGEIYNIGCDEGTEYSILDLAKILIKMIKKTEEYDQWITYIEDRPFNDARYYISNQKLKDLGWSIKKGFLDGIRDLVEE
jgi:dTDP-glucose 4,6-dehydratase